MLDLCLESISLLEKVKQEIIMSSHIISPSAKKKVAPSEKVTPSEEVEKGTKMLDDIEEPVVTIRRNNLNIFWGKSTGSTGWFNLDIEWLKENFLHLNRTSIFLF